MIFNLFLYMKENSLKKCLILTVFFLMGIQIVSAQQKVISEQKIPVDWSTREAVSIKDEVMTEVFSYLSRYAYYHVSFGTNDNSATTWWNNEVVFQTRQNPDAVRIEMVFNYFYIIFHFSNQQLIQGDISFSESWFMGLVAQNAFRRNVNEVLNRISLTMRGMNFGNKAKYETDRRWLKDLNLPLR